MNHHHLLHRIFLISMFIVCAVAVVFFMKQQVSASLTGDAVNNTSAGGTTNIVAVNGVCSKLDKTVISNEPAQAYRCISGTPSALVVTPTAWNWKCLGINGGTNAYCSASRYSGNTSSNTDTTTAPTSPVGSGETLNTQTATTPTAPIVNNPIVAGPTATTSITQSSSSSVGESETVRRSETIREEDEEDKDDSESSTTGNGLTTETQVVTPITDNKEQITTENYLQNENPEKSVVIKEPIVVEAKDLSEHNNPKVSGEVKESLKVEKVAINKKEDGKNNLTLTGKADPGAIISIYIFSNDPVIITVKADSEGNWNYELDKELADGEHEAYVAVTDDAGKIISKSEPIAFIKTAQAATVIPVSELTANKSPIERSSQQYILMAIMIMSVCLVIALILIGFLSHKNNLDEGIN